jgi:hypothetical protein
LLNVVIWLQENTLRTGDLLRRLVVSKICQDPSILFCGDLGEFLRAASHMMKTPPFHLTSTLRVATRKFSVQKVFFCWIIWRISGWIIQHIRGSGLIPFSSSPPHANGSAKTTKEYAKVVLKSWFLF